MFIVPQRAPCPGRASETVPVAVLCLQRSGSPHGSHMARGVGRAVLAAVTLLLVPRAAIQSSEMSVTFFIRGTSIPVIVNNL